MQKKTLWRIVFFAVLIILLTVILLLIFGISRIPPVSEQLPPDSAAFQVSILHPHNQSGWPKNYAIPIRISAWGAEPVTQIEFYINSHLYDTKSVAANQTYQIATVQWKWQPGDEGIYILTARAVGESGAFGISDPIMIKTGPEFITGSPMEIVEDTTLQQISTNQNLSLDELQQANPDLAPEEVLAPGDQVLLPNNPISIDNPIIAPFDPNGEEIIYPNPDEPEQEPSQKPIKWNIINDFSFLIKSKTIPEVQFPESNPETNQGDPSSSDNNTGDAKEESTTPPEPSKLPPAPELFGKFDGCTVQLNFLSLYNPDKDGYFLYRSRDGGEFERIATLPPHIENQNSTYFTDENQYGLVTYYASAFNIYGENPGPAISFPLDAMNCTNNNVPIHTSWIDEDGNLKLIAGMDTAYLYVQIDDGIAERVPEGNRMFLPKSGVSFNLTNYLDTREDLLNMTDFSIHMEIWGWNGGDLIFIGTIDQQIHRSILQVCDTEGEGTCTASSKGSWTNEMTIFPNIYKPLNEQKYELRWLTSNLSETDKICMGIGESFIGPGLTDSNPTILKLCYYNTAPGGAVQGNEGTYLLDFGKILYHDGNPQYPAYNGINEDYQYPDFDSRHPMGEPFDLAIRVLPVMDESGFNDMSNTVYMHHLSYFEESELPPLSSELPSLYDIEILENTYQAQEYEVYSKWACVIIESDPTKKYSPGQEVCPLTYVECGKNLDCEDSGFFAMLSAAWDFVVNSFEEAKSYVANQIADKIPYCDNSPACQNAVRKGVDYGVTALTGLPPDLPNSDEVIAQGITEVIVTELGDISDPQAVEYLCGDACKTEITNQIKTYVEQEQAYNSQAGCTMENPHYGYFPICFGPPIKVSPVLGSADFPGYVLIRVTRKNTPESLLAAEDRKKELEDKIQLRVTVDGLNTNRIGYYGSFCKYLDNISLSQLPDPSKPNSNANHGYTYLGDEPMQGQIYVPVMVPIPWLEPGESVDIPISLKAIANSGGAGCISTSMNQYLFYRGTSHMEATEYCFSADSTQLWVPCTNGGADTWDYDNPSAPGTSAWMDDIVDQVSDSVSGN